MPQSKPHWYAIRTHRDFLAEKVLAEMCREVYFPKETVTAGFGAQRLRAIIPHVLFVRTTREQMLEIEQRSRRGDGGIPLLWVYRYVRGGDIQRISEAQMAVLKLLTATDTSRCEIFNQANFRPGQAVRVIGGPYKDQVGFVQRVRKNRHVVVKIEGICLVMLPFIHPDLLEPIASEQLD